MNSFFSFLLAHRKDADQIDEYQTEHNWQLTTADDPTLTHWCSTKNSLSSFIISRTLPDAIRASDIERINKDEKVLSRQVIIHASDKDTADNIRNLIHGGVLLGYPEPQNTHLRGGGVLPADFPHNLDTEPFRHWFMQYDQTYYGCQVAGRAWGDRALVYAIEKYRFSLQLDCFTPHSADPRYGEVFPHKDPSYQSHVSACFAITAAYSVIEELGFEVRSSADKPRFIEKEQEDEREWNPIVLQDLDMRLQEASMSASTSFIWTYRGEPTAVEDESVRKAPPFGIESRWFGERGGEVRDREMSLADAIHLVSWLRNFITAHKFSELTQFISPYDVHNCQMVARRLILGALGLWQGKEAAD